MPKKPQIDKFREAARALEANEDEREFDKALRKMVHGIPKEAQETTDELADMLDQADRPKKPRRRK